MSAESGLNECPGSDPLLGFCLENRFEILEKVGSGAYATVYRVSDRLLPRDLALKVLHAHLLGPGTAVDRFHQESLLLASLDHPSIVKVYSRGELPSGQLYLLMDFVQGEELSMLLKRQGKLSLPVFFDVFEQILNGLSCAHEQNLIHRDLKPSNIMIFDDAGQLKVKILDFGIAKNLDDESNLAQTKTGHAIGTSAYMSPEQCSSAALDARCDLYSIACVMFEALTGSPPFSGSSDLDLRYKHVNQALSLGNQKLQLPQSLLRLLSKALAKKPEQRFQSAQEMLFALNQCKLEPESRNRKPLILAFLGLLLLVPAVCFISDCNNSRKALLKLDDPDNAILQGYRNVPALKRYIDGYSSLSADRKTELYRKWLKSNSLKGKEKLRQQAFAEIEIAKILISKEDLPAAHIALRDALSSKNQNLLDPKKRIDIYCQAGAIATKISDRFAAKYDFDHAEKILKDCQFGPKTEAYIKWASARSNSAFAFGDLEEAEYYARLSIADDENLDPLKRAQLRLSYVSIIDDGKHLKLQKQLLQSALACAALDRLGQNRAEMRETQKKLWLKLAEVSESLGEQRAAENAFQRLLKLCEKHFDEYCIVDQARIGFYLRNGMRQSAISELQRLIKEGSPGDGFLAYFGTRLLYSRVIDESQKAVLLKNYVEEWTLKGDHSAFTFVCVGQYNQALIELRDLYMAEGRGKDFLQFARSMNAKIPAGSIEHSSWALCLSGYFEILRDYNSALSWMRNCISYMPTDGPAKEYYSIARLVEARFLTELGRVQEAQEIVTPIFSQIKKESMKQLWLEASVVKAQILGKKGETQSEIELREQILKESRALFPNLDMRIGEQEAQLASAYEAVGRRTEALALFESAASTCDAGDAAHKASSSFFRCRALAIYLEKGDYAAAKNSLQRISNIDQRMASSFADLYRDYLQRMYKAAEKHSDRSSMERCKKLLAQIPAKNEKAEL
ncbi:MAG: serine/threonine protein kinase [Candidatus Obscuribacterales bacterium]|nr:serine/threonine protein kinase [Candidatus Obscuribacterales bacterium]